MGISEFCRGHKVERGYVITRELSDFSVLNIEGIGVKTRLLKIPAPLVCYWLGRSEVESTSMFDN